MKHLHLVTAVIEAGAGVALMGFPSAMVNLLLGAPLDAPAAVALGRLTGAALFALGIACWLASGDTKSRAARGLVAAMTFYNFVAVDVFLYAGVGLNLAGVALWPAILLHAAMAIWCVVCLMRNGAAMPTSTT
jgi:hypothetical protein